jgi:hypothetical protein
MIGYGLSCRYKKRRHNGSGERMTTYQVKCPCGTLLSVTTEMAGSEFVCSRCARKLAFAPPQAKPAPKPAAVAEDKPTRWFLARDKQRMGPYSSAQLKQFADAGNIVPADMILKEGRQKWVTAGSVKGLFKAAPPPAAAPDLPAAELLPIQNAPATSGVFTFSKGPSRAYAPRRQINSRWLLIGAGSAAIVIALAVVLIVIMNRGNGEQANAAGTGAGAGESSSSDKEPARKKQLDLTYVAADFNGAIVVHPARLLERPFVGKILDDKQIAGFFKAVDIDPRKIERVIVLLDPFPGGNVAFLPAVIAQFAEPVDGAAMISRVLEGAEKKTFEGKEYYWGKNQTAANQHVCACVVDDRTILGGLEPTLHKMLLAKDGQSPFKKSLPKVDLNHDVVVAFAMDQAERKDQSLPTIRQALGEVLKPTKDMIEGADKLGEQLAAVTMTLDFGGDTMLSIDLEAVDDKAAESIDGLAKNGVSTLKLIVPSVKKDIKGSLPDDAAQLSALIDDLVNGFTIQKDGLHVQLAIKMPRKFPELAEKYGLKLKDLANQPPGPKPPTQRPPGGIPKGVPKQGGKK